MSFSQRKGYKPARKTMQYESIDNELRIRLWNTLSPFFEIINNNWFRAGYHRPRQINEFVNRLWDELLKEPIDSIYQYDWPHNYRTLREVFMKALWHEVFDFIEFFAMNWYDEEIIQMFLKDCNSTLESESSAYRFVGNRITEITSKEEISEIEQALAVPLKPVSIHLHRALDLLSDKKSPDYRNSIKESISAVESICELITAKKTTLGQCLGEIEKKIGPIHGALKRAFDSLYGYTSSAEGIRHALMDESVPSSEDARFMLISCSAFINYLVSKASKAGIKIG